MELGEQIGEIKKLCNMTAYQPARWREIVETRSGRGATHNLPKDFIIALFEKIHDESIRRQLLVLEAESDKLKG
jgi:chorismate mutase